MKRSLVMTRLGMVWLGMAAALAGCTTGIYTSTSQPLDEARYSEAYPYYAQLCALSEMNKKPGFGTEIESGGSGGHSVLFLSEVCRVKDAGYPVLALCDASVPKAERGVGLSVNEHFSNANWVATQGHDFFFNGGQDSDAPLTRESYAETQFAAEDRNILAGIIYHPHVFAAEPPGMGTLEYMYDVSVGTDYAIGFGRNRFCARVPLSRDQMQGVVDYLNGINAPYRSGSQSFEWNVLGNNCSHLTHNALSAVDVWRQNEIDRFPVIAAFNIPVPKNEFVDLVRRTNDMDIGDLGAVFHDADARADLMEEGRLPTEPGALAEDHRAMRPNEVYDTNSRLIFFDDPVLATYQGWFDDIFADPRYTDLDANAAHFTGLYNRILSEKRPLRETIREYGIGTDEQTDFAAFYTRFYAYIQAQRARMTEFAASRP